MEKENKFLYRKYMPPVFRGGGFLIYSLVFFCNFIGLSNVNAENLHSKLNQDSSDSKFIDFKIQQKIESIKNIYAVTLVIDTPYSEHAIGWDEATLREFGCRYETQDADQISEIIDIVKNGKIKARPKEGMQSEIREGIFLMSKYGEEIKFLFGQKYYDGEDVDGLFDGGAISASSELPSKLYRWAAKVDSNSNNSCNSFILQY